MNRFKPALSPWLYVGGAMAIGVMLGRFFGFVHLSIFSIFIVVLSLILKHTDALLLLPFLLSAFFRSYTHRTAMDSVITDKVEGTFSVYNESLLRIPGSTLYLKTNLRDIPHGAVVRLKGDYIDSIKFVLPQRVSLLSLDRSIFSKIHRKLAETLSSLFGYYEEGLLIKALIMGDKKSLNKETVDGFKKSGTAHLLAISGLHVNLLFVVLYTLFMFLLRNRWVSELISINLVLLYTLSLGPLAPCLRALFFILFNTLSGWVKRKANPLNVWGCAFSFSILLFPDWLFDPSFIFSYATIFGYILFEKPLASKTKNAIIRALGKYLYSVSIPFIFTLPFQIIFFRTFSIMGFLSNLVMVPLVSLTIFETLFALFFHFLIKSFSYPFVNCALFIAKLSLLITRILSQVPPFTF